MKTYFFRCLAAIFSIVAIISCEKPDNTQVSDVPEIKITNSPLSVPYYNNKASLEYVVDNAVKGGEIYAECDSDWISEVMAEDGKVLFSVLENLEEEERNADIVLHYEYSDGKEVTAMGTVIQSGVKYDYNLEMTEHVAEYLGFAENIHVYSIIIADSDCLAPRSKNVQLQLLVSEKPDYDNVVFPTGTFVLDDEVKDGVLYSENTVYVEYGASTEWPEVGPTSFSSGSVTISESAGVYSLEGVLKDVNGDIYHVSFSGKIDVVDNSYYSTLDKDVVLKLDNHDAEATFYGDYAGFGTSNWYLWITPNDNNGDRLLLDLYYSSSYKFEDGFPEGVFVSGKEGKPETFYPGYITDTSLQCSWYYVMKNGNYDNPHTPLSNGKITVTDNRDGTYTVTIDCKDDNYRESHKVTGTWTGNVTMKDESAAFFPSSEKMFRMKDVRK